MREREREREREGEAVVVTSNTMRESRMKIWYLKN